MTAPTETSRWLAISMPQLSTDRLRRARPELDRSAPLVTYAKQGNALLLTGVDRVAEACGLRAGVSLADARAMQPAMIAVEADEKADLLLLDRIAAWCERYGPVVVVDAPDGLFLEVSGSAHLFGGAAALMADVAQRLKKQGLFGDYAIAPTPGAAWAFARWKSGAVVEADALAGLADLPVAALRLAPDVATFLRRAGLKTIGQIASAPRSVFAARAGEKAMRRMDQVLGRVGEALTPRRPPPPVFAQRRLMEPIFHTDAVLIVAETLIREALEQLERRDAGLKAARLILFAVDGADRVIGIGASRPERDERALLRLIREKLNRFDDAGDVDLGGEFGFEAARLEVTALERIQHGSDALSAALVSEETASAARVATLIDVLSARLGADCVTRPVLVDAHQPEKQGVWKSALATPAKATVAPKIADDGVLRRPLTLFARPQPIETISIAPDGPPITFRWRRLTRKIARSDGPERITPDWLKAEDSRTRDYYRVEDADGRRYWLYREGVYGGETPPHWFIHGLFP